MAVIVKIRPFYGTVFGVYGSGSLPYTTRRQYGRNTVPTERVIYCQYTVVNIAFTDILVNVNGRRRSCTVVVMVGQGKPDPSSDSNLHWMIPTIIGGTISLVGLLMCVGGIVRSKIRRSISSPEPSHIVATTIRVYAIEGPSICDESAPPSYSQAVTNSIPKSTNKNEQSTSQKKFISN